MRKEKLEFRTLPGLWQEYTATERSLAFKAKSISEAQDWQSILRDELITLLGGFPEDSCDLSPQVLETHQEDGFTCQKVAIQTVAGEHMPCFVLIPPKNSACTLAGKTGRSAGENMRPAVASS